MKLRNLLIMGGAAVASYWLVNNHKTILDRSQENLENLKQVQEDLETVKERFAALQQFQEPVQELIKDTQYKVRVYQQSIAGNVEEIKKMQDKYTAESTQ